MKRINDEKLNNINGGMSGWAIAGISLLVTFVAGIIDGIARPRACRGQKNMKVKDKELYLIKGGSDIGATILNYLSTAIKTVYDVGQQLGGAIRRIATGKVCPL